MFQNLDSQPSYAHTLQLYTEALQVLVFATFIFLEIAAELDADRACAYRQQFKPNVLAK